MAVAITVTNINALGYLCDVQVTGLTPATKYDVMRRLYRYTGDGDTATPHYEMWLPDRRSNWSAVAHRVGWTAPASGTMSFRDYEPPIRPFAYFVVESSKIGPTEYDFDNGDYPLSRGVLDDQVVHINYLLGLKPPTTIVLRSTTEIGKWVQACVYDLPTTRYTARGTEFPVVHRQYPVYVADTREARRGQIVLAIDDLAQYNLIREVVFPPNGRVKPLVVDAIGDKALLLDNMTIVALDVNLEQATQHNADLRFCTIDYVEVDPTLPSDLRSGDNDDLTNAPNANFTVGPGNLHSGDWVTLTDTSTGQYDSWEWSWSRTNGPADHSRVQAPPKFRWFDKGPKTVRLRVYGSVAGPKGADVITKTVTVH
jgi:hypothetical protein